MTTNQSTTTTVELKDGIYLAHLYETEDASLAIRLFIRDLIDGPQLIVLQVQQPDVLVIDEVAATLQAGDYIRMSDWIPDRHGKVYIIGHGGLYRVAKGIISEDTYTVDQLFLEDEDGTERESRYILSITPTEDPTKVVVQNLLGAMRCPNEIIKKLTTWQ